MDNNSLMALFMNKWMLMSLIWILFTRAGCIEEYGVRKYSLISHLHRRSKVFGLRQVDIHSEYRFQIHQASLYSIDLALCLPWKESDYFFTQSVRTHRGQQQRSGRIDPPLTSVFIFWNICLGHIYIWWKENWMVAFFFFLLFDWE